MVVIVMLLDVSVWPAISVIAGLTLQGADSRPSNYSLCLPSKSHQATSWHACSETQGLLTVPSRLFAAPPSPPASLCSSAPHSLSWPPSRLGPRRHQPHRA